MRPICICINTYSKKYKPPSYLVDILDESKKAVKDSKLNQMLKEFKAGFAKGRFEYMKKEGRDKLMYIGEYMYGNYFNTKPVYKYLAKVIGIDFRAAQATVIDCYSELLDQRIEEAVWPIVKRIVPSIINTNAQFIRSANLFEKEREELSRALITIKDIEDKKQLLNLELAKKRKAEIEYSPTGILKSKLIALLLKELKQEDNIILEEGFNRETNSIIKELGELHGITSISKNYPLSFTEDVDYTVWSEDNISRSSDEASKGSDSMDRFHNSMMELEPDSIPTLPIPSKSRSEQKLSVTFNIQTNKEDLTVCLNEEVENTEVKKREQKIESIKERIDHPMEAGNKFPEVR